MDKPYKIFFFAPGDERLRLAEYDSSVPPPAYHVGDLFDGRNISNEDRGNHGMCFKIIAVEHQVIPTVKNQHQAHQFFVGVHLEEISSEEYDKIRQTN